MLRFFLLFIMFFCLPACIELGSHYSDRRQSIEVDYFLQQCADDSPQLCFRIRSSASDDWRVTQSLDGFDGYQWGKRYELEVDTRFDSKGKAASYQYHSTRSETLLSDPFTLTLHTVTGVISRGSGDRWLLEGGQSFTCSGDQCSSIQSAVSNQQVLQLEMKADKNRLALSLVKCQSSSTDFASQCEGVSASRWQIAHFQSDCNRTSPQLCSLYRINNSDRWELLPTQSSDIEGFTPEWGKEYRIDISKTLSSGGRLTKAELKKQDIQPVDKTGSSSPFKFILQASFLKASDFNNRITLYDGGAIMNCDRQCQSINLAITQRHLLLLNAYIDSNKEVVVTAVECNALPGTAFDTCVKDKHEDVHWWP